MKITFGMPELLVISGVFLYSQSWGISITLLVLGLISRICGYSLDYAKEQEDKNQKELEKKKNEEILENFQETLLSLTAQGRFLSDETSH